MTTAVTTTEESKPGYLTTEFWLVIVANVLTQLDALQLPQKYHGIVLVGSVLGYTLSRGLAKAGVASPVAARRVRKHR